MHYYTDDQEFAIRHRILPDALLATEFGVTDSAVRRKRRHMGGYAPPTLAKALPSDVTVEERAEVAREEIVALQARIEETEALLCELGRMLIAARKRLVRLT